MFRMVERFIRENPHLDGPISDQSFSSWNYRYYVVFGPGDELLMTTHDSKIAIDAVSRLNAAVRAKRNRTS